jgi:pilus assembly protein Flp/PilA
MDRPSRATCRPNEDGATASEYALLASLIAVLIIGSVALLGTSLNDLYDRSCDDVAGVAEGADC